MSGNDTIAAISTPLGEGGIGIVRISGDKAAAIARALFKTPQGKTISRRATKKMHYGFIIDPDDSSLIDEVLISYMKSPNTYTKEDIVEINCHGGTVALRETLALVVSQGARLAGPGEFTKRAFINGRLDLAQAEAVQDLIRAKTERGKELAIRQLKGGLSQDVVVLKRKLERVLVELEAAVDFSDEDITTTSTSELVGMIQDASAGVKRLLSTAHEGELIKNGIKVAIIGKPNVGKSSLLNALLRRERAIVTPIPGTTRDVIEEIIIYKGAPFSLSDTAGIRDTNGSIEKIGVARSRKSLKDADLVLCVLDGSKGLSQEDIDVIKELGNKPSIIVINKRDLPLHLNIGEVESHKSPRCAQTVKVSALKMVGIEDLMETSHDLMLSNVVYDENNTIVTSVRHEAALKRAEKSLSQAERAFEKGLSEECAATDIREALDGIGEITGETTTEDILEKIFDKFCIGK